MVVVVVVVVEVVVAVVAVARWVAEEGERRCPSLT